MKMILSYAMLCALLPSIAKAEEFEDVNALDTQIEAHTGGAAYKVDPRLKLSRCTQPLTFDEPVSGAIAVRCDVLGWRIRVPLSVGIAARPTILRGQNAELVIIGSGFEIMTNVTALEDGVTGQKVRVKSPTGTTSMMATVRADGLLEIRQ